MKPRYIFYLIYLFVLVFWAFFYPHHVLFIEQNSLFLYTCDFIQQYLCQPAGWAGYAGHFISQFYIFMWVGAIIQTLFFVAICELARKILSKVGLVNNMSLLSIVPGILLLSFQLNYAFNVANTLQFIFPYLFIYFYVANKQSSVKYLIFSFLPLFTYLLAGFGSLLLLYSAIIVYELFFEKNRARCFCILAWVCLLIIIPQVWRNVVLIPNKNLYQIIVYEANILTTFMLISFIPFTFLLAKILLKKRSMFSNKLLILIINVAVLFCIGGYYFYKGYDKLNECKFGMYQSTVNNDWDEVLKIGNSMKYTDEHTRYFINLALAMKGELPENLFAYKQSKSKGLLLNKHKEYLNMLYGSEFYYRIGMMNEAIHWVFEASIINYAQNYMALKRLALWNHIGGYPQAADKYYKILDNTLFYNNLRAKQKMQVIQTDSSDFSKEFFVGGRETLTDLVRFFDNNPTNKLASDYILCSILISKELEVFDKYFEHYYVGDSEILPRLYQEAYLALKKNDKVDEETVVRYNEFVKLANNGDNNLLKKKFANSLWYYLYLN